MTEKMKDQATAKGIVMLEEEHLDQIHGGFEKKNGVVTLPGSSSAAAGGSGELLAPQSTSEKLNDLTGPASKFPVDLAWGPEHKFR